MSNLQFILEQLGSSLLYIHKLQIRTKVKQEHYYDELNISTTNGKDHDIKFHFERINQARVIPDVEYNIFPNGTAMIYTSCSNNPFRLYGEDAAAAILSYLGKVEDG